MREKLKSAALFVWQLPQNLLGLVVRRVLRAARFRGYYVFAGGFLTSVSLGSYVLINVTKPCGDDTLRHERGHSAQSLRLGWLYLPVIGLPSALGNMADRILHGKWDAARRRRWYYSLPWEAWADRLGGVDRREET